MFERFTDRARRVVVLAQEEARLLNHNYIGTEHILLGLIHEGEGIAALALAALDISIERVRAEVEEVIGHGSMVPSGHIPFTPRAKKVLELSLREALQLGHNYIGTEHVLLGLIREGEGVAAQVLVKLGADLNRVRAQVVHMLSGFSGSKEGSSEGSRVVRSGFGPDTDDAAISSSVSVGPVGPDPQPVCSFCGRDLWEATHYVRGEAAVICDECAGAAAAALAAAPPDQHALSLPYRVYGTEPEPGAAAEIGDAIGSTFGTVEPRAMLARVERGQELVETTERLLARRADALPPFVVSIDRIRFLSDDLAMVRVTHVVAAVVARRYEIGMRQADGRWVVVQQSFVEVVAAMIAGSR